MSYKNLLIVTTVQGMLMISLKTQLESQGHKITMTNGEFKEISKVLDNMSGVLLYCNEELAANQQSLIYLRDKCMEDGIPVFLIGDQSEVDSVDKIIPKNTVAKTFLRPFNVNEATEDITTYLDEHDKSTRKKVLVVDDSGAMLRNVKGWLEDRYQVILANSGAMAIKYLTLNKPDLVLLDYEMPVVDGRQVLEMIRSEIDFADVPVIFLTSKNDKESVANVVKLKPEGYLLKTMKPEEIVKSVDDFFMRQKAKEI